MPAGPAAVVAALHFRDPRLDALDTLDGADWLAAVAFADRSQLTLPLRAAARERFPEWLRDRTDQDLEKNRGRVRRLEELYRSLDERLRDTGIEYVALKGLTQCPHFGTPAELRVQFDVDLVVPRESAERAGALVCSLGFDAMEEEQAPTDHLPPFAQRTDWEWSGDFFDPRMPIAVEVHFQFWNRPVERIEVQDVARFWERRTTRRVAGIAMPVLCAADGLGYAALHLLRHLLRGSARPYHIYEIAGFLEGHAADGAFWREWQRLHSPEFRRLQAVIFRLAAEWFGCELGPTAEQEAANLRPATRAWFRDFALSPAVGIFHAHKDELWLQLSLLDSWRDKLAAARLRLLPMNVPGPLEAPATDLTMWKRIRRRARWCGYVASRLRRHVSALPHAVRMAWRGTNLSGDGT